MLEVNQPDPIVGDDQIFLHNFVDSLRHFEITMFETSFNQQIEQVDLQVDAVVWFQLSYDLP